MSNLENYLRIALSKADGNKLRARQSLLQAATADPMLAQALALPHLPSIIAHAIDHYMRQYNMPDAEAVVPEAAPAPEEKKQQGIPPTVASEDHRSAVLAMVAAFNKKKD